MSITQPNTTKVFEPALQTLIMKELERVMNEEWENEKKKFMEMLDRRRAEIISASALYLMSQIEINKGGDLLTIRLETKKV